MAKIVKKPVVKRGNVMTIYSNIGTTLEGRPIKDIKQRPRKRSPKKKNVGPI